MDFELVQELRELFKKDYKQSFGVLFENDNDNTPPSEKLEPEEELSLENDDIPSEEKEEDPEAKTDDKLKELASEDNQEKEYLGCSGDDQHFYLVKEGDSLFKIVDAVGKELAKSEQGEDVKSFVNKNSVNLNLVSIDSSFVEKYVIQPAEEAEKKAAEEQAAISTQSDGGSLPGTVPLSSDPSDIKTPEEKAAENLKPITKEEEAPEIKGIEGEMTLGGDEEIAPENKPEVDGTPNTEEDEEVHNDAEPLSPEEEEELEAELAEKYLPNNFENTLQEKYIKESEYEKWLKEEKVNEDSVEYTIKYRDLTGTEKSVFKSTHVDAVAVKETLEKQGMKDIQIIPDLTVYDR